MRFSQSLVSFFVAWIYLHPAVFAQSFDAPCFPRPASANGRMFLGMTNDNRRLELDPYSIQNTRRGMQFTYYLNGSRNVGYTKCRRNEWFVPGFGRIPATSRAARAMLDYVCGGYSTN